MKTTLLMALTLAASALFAACGGDSDQVSPTGTAGSTPTELDTSAFSATVDNALFPLNPGDSYIYEGEETDPDTGETTVIRVESTVLAETHRVSGVEVRVVEVKEYEDGDLVESTRDYFAQDSDGTVYYMGEDVDDYKDGELVGHHGAWLHRQDGAQAGEFMPLDPAVGDVFEQERAPGIAEDTSTVIETGIPVTTPAGAFEDCIKTQDYDPISDATEYKYYCPTIGLVREESEDSFLDLISY
jgi:hypothetical protein